MFKCVLFIGFKILLEILLLSNLELMSIFSNDLLTGIYIYLYSTRI